MASVLQLIGDTTGISFEYELESDVRTDTLFGRLLGGEVDAFLTPLTYGIPEAYVKDVVVGGPIYTGVGTLLTRRSKVESGQWVRCSFSDRG
jgi:hypothetical protein